MFGWRKNDIKSIKQCIYHQKHTFERINNILCKNTLGLRKHTTDLLSKAELGRYPIFAKITKIIFNYWQHILISDDSSLLRQTIIYLIGKDREGQTNYYTRLKALLSFLNCKSLIYECSPSIQKNKSKEIYEAYCKQNQGDFFSILKEKASREKSGGRYDIYYKVKKNYRFENYLNMPNAKLRRNISSIRLSTHCLPVEWLRKFKVDRMNRLCTLCSKNEVGTEEHILLHCDNKDINYLRTEFFSKLSTINNQWHLLENNHKLIYLLCAANENINFYLAIYLEKVFKIVKCSYDKKKKNAK